MPFQPSPIRCVGGQLRQADNLFPVRAAGCSESRSNSVLMRVYCHSRSPYALATQTVGESRTTVWQSLLRTRTCLVLVLAGLRLPVRAGCSSSLPNSLYRVDSCLALKPSVDVRSTLEGFNRGLPFSGSSAVIQVILPKAVRYRRVAHLMARGSVEIEEGMAPSPTAPSS